MIYPMPSTRHRGVGFRNGPVSAEEWAKLARTPDRIKGRIGTMVRGYPPVVERQVPSEKLPFMSTRYTILVVDDEPHVVRSVQDLLRLDYRVLGATSAAEGLAALREQDVHVIITDQRMPG